MNTSPSSLPDICASADRHGERGIAIIMTLGVLALMLMLAMSFAYTARTERRAAGANADVVRARLLAESGVERAIAILRSMPTALPDYNDHLYPGKHFNHPDTGAWSTRPFIGGVNDADVTGVDEALHIRLQNTNAVDYIPANIPSAADIGWQHVWGNDRIVDTIVERNALTAVPVKTTCFVKQTNQVYIYVHNTVTDTYSWDEFPGLIGRIAFLIIDDSGRIDPNSITDNSADNSAVSRIGRYETEVQMQDVGLGATTTTALLTESDVARFFSQAHLARKALATSVAAAELCLASFMPLDRPVAEQYWDGATGVSRFYLDDIKDKTVDQLLDPTTGIPWLSQLEASDPGEDSETLRKQVAANLVDYFDTNSYATTDYNPTTKDATYVGIEKVPFINEAVFFIYTGTIDGEEDLKYRIGARVELVNMFGTDRPGGRLELQAVFSGKRAVTESPVVLNFDTSWDAIPFIDANSYYFFSLLIIYGILEDFILVLENLKVESAVVIYGDDDPITAGKLWDFSSIGPQPDGDKRNIPVAVPFEPVPSEADYSYVSVRVMDPRHNTSGTGPDSNWRWSGWGESTLAAPNASVAASWDGERDHESIISKTNPATGISTAFVRDEETMQGLWELGAIHRGERWRTLNLTRHHANEAAPEGSYAAGDARLLEEIHVNPAGESRGKINMNSPFRQVWQAIFASVATGAEYDDPGTGSGFLNETKAAAIATAARNINIDPAATVFTDRGQLLTKLAADATVADLILSETGPQRRREEVISKVAHLLTANRNAFTVVVAAQAVRDLGTVANAFTETQKAGLSKYDPVNNKWCEVLAEQKILAIIHRDPFSGEVKIESMQYIYD